MENLTVIKNIKVVYWVLLALFFSSYNYAQNQENDFYKLYKDGEHFKKEIVCIKIDKYFKKIKNTTSTKYIYKDKMVFLKTKYKPSVKDKKELNSKKCIYPEELNVLEKRNIENSIQLVYKNKGFKPVYPLKNITLKIFICDENGEHTYVKWIDNNF